MNKSMCGDAGCPFQEQIEAVYKDLLIGNGEGPLKGRVRHLEAEMATALPILTELKEAAIRHDERDKERFDAEKRRDKAWARFRASLVAIAAIGTLIIALIELDRNVTHTFLHSQTTEQLYTAHSRKLPQDADNQAAYLYRKH